MHQKNTDILLTEEAIFNESPPQADWQIIDQSMDPEEYRIIIKKLTAIIAGMHEGVLYANARDMITEANPWFLSLIGQDRHHILGRYLYDLEIFRAFPELGNIIQNFEDRKVSDQIVLEHEIEDHTYQFHIQPIYQEEQYIGVIINIIDITQLVNARKLAESSNRLKSEFMATMSHEIRTPMNSIIGFSELLVETELNETQTDYLQAIRDNSHTLLSIINDILDFSKIESGRLFMERAPVNLRQIFEELHFMFGPIATKKKITYELNIADDVPRTIESDPTRLKQCLVNLINNAIKFTAQGTVGLNACMCLTDGIQCLRMDVSDTGIGIESDKKELIFEAFSQADNSTTRSYGGTGLGLSITRKLVELLGGRLEFESTPQIGSTFSVLLPIYQDPLQTDLWKVGIDVKGLFQQNQPVHQPEIGA